MAYDSMMDKSARGLDENGVRHGLETESLVLALDVGTSGVRGALFNSRARELTGTASRIVRGPEATHAGEATLDADEALEQAATTVDAVLAKSAGPAARIQSVAVSCFWHSLVGVNDEGRAVTPVFGWGDTRAARAAEELRARFDERATHARTGCRFHPSYWPAKLLWLRREHADVYKRVSRWMSFGEYLLSRFCGEAAASLSMASGTGLLDLRRCVWDEELLAFLGLDTAQMPAISATDAAFNSLTPEYARRWPQLSGARLSPAVADGAANNVGSGCTTHDRAALMIGTSGAMRVMWEGSPPDGLPPALWCYRVDDRRVLVGGALSDGGGLYHWLNEVLALEGDSQRVEEELAAMEPDAHGLTVLPFWSGERSTGWAPEARGAILGLTTATR
ncbi:MAG TPA: gluconokinase, partial [Pyrinomonadaceae bacterium]